ncbi:SAM-dependent methyltransferase [Actinomadura atramentaria]|uniref:SAM-dependent methyltransferase n=1 Tax=Actinomadura atramentaria TaxID=1990 RepID=UPI0003682952|nr:SAM-dependent methyltransferase [Actinomadura atramentaria]
MSTGPQPAIDTSVPHSARIWDYWLGGKDNYRADREAGDEVLRYVPDIAVSARQDRAFLGRAVRFAVERGIRQFLDVGSGLPTAVNTHEAAQRLAPESRVVYVDNDPLVLVHARALLSSSPEGVTEYLEADMREPAKVVEAAARTLDFGRPTALLLLGVLNHVLDGDEARDIVRRLCAPLAPGSLLIVSHTCDHTSETLDGEAMRRAVRSVMERGGTPICARSRDDIAAFFTGVELLEPGVVSCSQWRPDAPVPPREVPHFAGVGLVAGAS